MNIYHQKNKCVSRPSECSQRENLPAENVSFTEVFYSYSTKSEKNPLNRQMKERIKEIAEKCGFKFFSFEKEKIGTYQLFCKNICSKIQRCAVLIADVTPISGETSPIATNIAHEIGLAQAFRKNILLVTTSERDKLAERYFSNLVGFEIALFPDDLDKIYDFLSEVRKSSFPAIHIIMDSNEFQEYAKRLEIPIASRFFYSGIIPSMMRSSKFTLKIIQERKVYPFGDDLLYIRKYFALVNERRKLFRDMLKEIKRKRLPISFRDIYNIRELENYCKTGEMIGKEECDHPEEVLTRIKGVITTYKKFYPAYQVGLLETGEAPYKFLIKEGYGVLIDNVARKASKNALAIFSTIKNFVEENEILFHRLWEMSINKKSEVMEKLKYFRKLAEERV